ncbi:hypothetical protein KKA14_04905 [bacterium]|nr:hypothetical protein [bacterium]
MLRFYGIRFNGQGVPERFNVSYALRESLHAGLYINDFFQEDQEKTINAINDEIEKLFAEPANKKNTKKFRFMVAKWFRTKDIVQFIYKDKQTCGLKLKIAGILDTPETIEAKWDSIKTEVMTYVSDFSSDEINGLLSNSESDLSLIFEMVSLFFLEQDDETPPANLELHFIRSQFPKIIWKKQDGFNASTNPFWLPKNQFCRPSFLAMEIISTMYKGAEVFNTKLQVNNQQAVLNSFNSLHPEQAPDEIYLELAETEDENSQLSMIPETAAETLISLQKIIQKRFTHEGVKHFLAILRQFAETQSGNICHFDTFKHLNLVSSATMEGTFSDKQCSIFESVFKILQSMRVKRFWGVDSSRKQVTNPFILEVGNEISGSNVFGVVKKVLLDPLFLPGPGNPFRLGNHLTLISQRLFRESIQKHALLPGLSSYLTGTWLNEFPKNRGVTEKTSKEIIEGCAFNITPANKFRILHKLESELAYMTERSYISAYNLRQDKEGNPWNNVHQLIAPEVVMKGIADKMQVVGTNFVSEKLIA